MSAHHPSPAATFSHGQRLPNPPSPAATPCSISVVHKNVLYKHREAPHLYYKTLGMGSSGDKYAGPRAKPTQRLSWRQKAAGCPSHLGLWEKQASHKVSSSPSGSNGRKQCPTRDAEHRRVCSGSLLPLDLHTTRFYSSLAGC
jgi:hypothetical protein